MREEKDPAAGKRIVTAGYDRCGPRYNEARSSEGSPELESLLGDLPAGADVLDVGCGGGSPVTRALSERCALTGVDISPVQVEEARRRMPGARFIAADIMTLHFDAESFDAIVSFYALFHLPRDEHRPLLERFAGWLRPGGRLLISVAHSSHPGYTEPDFFGVTMYWSHHASPWYVDTLESLGFEILRDSVTGHGYREDSAPAERHPVILARLPVA